MASKQTLRDVMTPEPIVLDASATVQDAARAMKARNVGDVLVRQNGKLRGIVTLGDLAVERDRDSALAKISAAPPQH